MEIDSQHRYEKKTKNKKKHFSHIFTIERKHYRQLVTEKRT